MNKIWKFRPVLCHTVKTTACWERSCYILFFFSLFYEPISNIDLENSQKYFCLLWKNFKWQERLHICKCEIFATWIPSDNVYSLVLKKAKEINIARRSSNGKKFSHNRWPKTNSHLQIAFFPILSFFIIEKITSGLFF